MSDEKQSPQAEFFGALEDAGLLDYGVSISSVLVHELLGLEFPETGTHAQFRALDLQELAAIDYVRVRLLMRGMYITSTAAGYRILLPSENQAQIERYIQNADKKLVRALKLSRNSPGLADVKNNDHTEARIIMKRIGAKRLKP